MRYTLSFLFSFTIWVKGEGYRFLKSWRLQFMDWKSWRGLRNNAGRGLWEHNLRHVITRFSIDLDNVIIYLFVRDFSIRSNLRKSQTITYRARIVGNTECNYYRLSLDQSVKQKDTISDRVRVIDRIYSIRFDSVRSYYISIFIDPFHSHLILFDHVLCCCSVLFYR